MYEGKPVSTIFLENLQFLQKSVCHYLPGKTIDQLFKEPTQFFSEKNNFLFGIQFIKTYCMCYSWSRYKKEGCQVLIIFDSCCCRLSHKCQSIGWRVSFFPIFQTWNMKQRYYTTIAITIIYYNNIAILDDIIDIYSPQFFFYGPSVYKLYWRVINEKIRAINIHNSR